MTLTGLNRDCEQSGQLFSGVVRKMHSLDDLSLIDLDMICGRFGSDRKSGQFKSIAFD